MPPVRLHFDYSEGMTKKNDLTVCFARRHKQPNISTCEKVFHRPVQALLETVDPYYLQPYLYLGLYSDQGCTFSLKVFFPKDDLKEMKNSNFKNEGMLQDDSKNN